MPFPLARLSRLTRGLIALAGVGVVSACQLLVGLEPNIDPPLATDGGADADVDARPPLPTACDDSPPPPPKKAVIDDQGPPLSFVLASASFSGDDAGVDSCPLVGFDLDGRTTCIDPAGQPTATPCTGDAECASSCVPATGARVCDGPHGIDNAISLLVGDRGALSVLNNQAYRPSEFVSSGATNLLLTITGYNGEADDPDVSVSSYFSTGLEDRTDQRTVGDAGEPGWDGRSLRRWTIDPASVDTTGFAHLGQFAGYVNNHVLVVIGARLEVPFGPLQLDLYGGRLTGELRRREDGLWNIVFGRVGGRVSTNQLIDVIARAPFANSTGVIHLCDQGDLALAGVRNFICARADLASDGGSEAHCNELSLGLGFTAVPAIIGRLRERDISSVGCPGQTFPGCP